MCFNIHIKHLYIYKVLHVFLFWDLTLTKLYYPTKELLFSLEKNFSIHLICMVMKKSPL